MKKAYLVMALIVVALIIWAVFSHTREKPPEPVTREPYRVGVAASLTGPGAFIGESYTTGLKLAQVEVNSQGGINGRQLELVIEDNQNTAQGGVNAFQALHQKRPDIILSTMSAATVPLSPLAKDAGYSLYMSAVFADVTSGNSNSASFFPLPEDDAIVTINDMSRLGVKTASVIYINSEYGLASLDAFKRTAGAKGITVLTEEAFAGDVKDFATQAAKAASSKPDSIYIIAIATTPILDTIKQVGYTGALFTNVVPILGGLHAQSPTAFEGVHVTAPLVAIRGTPAYEKFEQLVKDRTQPLGLGHASIAYDNLHALAEVLKKNPDPKQFVPTFSTFGAFTGINGTFNLSSRKVGIPLYPAIVRNGQLERVE
jgi:branched-chain amino acid transport system substrate-binding protein